MSGLSEAKLRTKDNQTCAEGSSGCTATSSLQSQEHGGSEKDTADGREQTHGDIGDTGLEVILANILEVKISIKAGQVAEKGDHKLGQRGVDVHEEFAFDVLGSETAEAVAAAWSVIASREIGGRAICNILDLVEDDAGRLVDFKQPHDGGHDGDSQQQLVVRSREEKDIVILHALRAVVFVLFRCDGLGLLGFRWRW